MAVDLEARHLDEVRRILSRHVPRAQVYVFGSRATGKAGRFSDLDLALDTEQGVSLQAMAELRAAFSESDLPILVDIVDWRTLDPEFKAAIEKQREPL